MSEGSVRLQKYLASAGVSSRRKAEELIVGGPREGELAGRSPSSGRRSSRAATSSRWTEGSSRRAEGRAYYLLYKPPGCVTTASDPEGRPTALDYLRGVKERVFPVGRLDFDAEGALLFTDDGELANRLAHPRYGHRRTYLVKVKGDPEPEALLRMTAGVRLDDGPARALEATVHERAEKNVWVRVVVAEGRFHLVKRLCEAVGLQVQRLFRPEFGGLTVERAPRRQVPCRSRPWRSAACAARWGSRAAGRSRSARCPAARCPRRRGGTGTGRRRPRNGSGGSAGRGRRREPHATPSPLGCAAARTPRAGPCPTRSRRDDAARASGRGSPPGGAPATLGCAAARAGEPAREPETPLERARLP